MATPCGSFRLEKMMQPPRRQLNYSALQDFQEESDVICKVSIIRMVTLTFYMLSYGFDLDLTLF